MGWFMEWICRPFVVFVAFALVIAVAAWASAIGWHIGRRDAAKWFGPTKSDHDIHIVAPKKED